MSYKFKKGDRVKVWSLQSFNQGGFLNGEPAIVRQSQTGDSVILAVVRNFDGVYKVDESYEVYAKQCELITDPSDLNPDQNYANARKDLENHHKNLMANPHIN